MVLPYQVSGMDESKRGADRMEIEKSGGTVQGVISLSIYAHNLWMPYPTYQNCSPHWQSYPAGESYGSLAVAIPHNLQGWSYSD